VEVRCPTNLPAPTATASRSSTRMIRRTTTRWFAVPVARFSARSINSVDMSSGGRSVRVLSPPVAEVPKRISSRVNVYHLFAEFFISLQLHAFYSMTSWKAE
jgi:hypothetical protein